MVADLGVPVFGVIGVNGGRGHATRHRGLQDTLEGSQHKKDNITENLAMVGVDLGVSVFGVDGVLGLRGSRHR